MFAKRIIITLLILLICVLGVLYFDKAKKLSLDNRIVAKPTQTISSTPTSLSNSPDIPSSAPTEAPNLAQPGEHCGGFIRNAKQCISGYHCQLGHIPDAGGICVAN